MYPLCSIIWNPVCLMSWPFPPPPPCKNTSIDLYCFEQVSPVAAAATYRWWPIALARIHYNSFSWNKTRQEGVGCRGSLNVNCYFTLVSIFGHLRYFFFSFRLWDFLFFILFTVRWLCYRMLFTFWFITSRSPLGKITFAICILQGYSSQITIYNIPTKY